MSSTNALEQYDPDSIAIVGMACRFPGASNVDQFWRNLCDGVESITFFSDEELLEAGVAPAELENPNYVRARPIIEDAELFDAAFFNISPREAEVLDPQHRVFLECAWSVLESAGYDPETYPGRIGVYAGAELSSYLLNNLATNRGHLAVSGLQVVLGADRAYLSTRVSYELNLKGPSITVQTSCSTSLVAMHLACESLMNSECDLALAGGVTVSAPIKAGYYYQEGGILSPDGRCRAFDASSQGTLFGSGAGVVALKRLEDALDDGDHIHAVVRGSAINNDGSLKVGYTAPSVDGQAAAIAEALDVAGVSAETITYVEAHGTATELGDPIEIAALTQAFRRSTQARGYCAIGSVKSNVGHLATAAGMAGLIKTALALEHGLLPPSLHFEQPNPQIDFDDSPFYVNTTLRRWQGNGAPRRAGVSAFGMGGTNAHVVLEQPPRTAQSGTSRSWQLLTLSAKIEPALESATDQLAAYLQQHPELDLADVAYTLQLGRRAFAHRRVLACQGLEDAVSALQTRDPKRVLSGLQEIAERPVAFMFPGLGDQYPNMALELYQVELAFRAQVDRCCEFLKPLLGLDLRDALFPKEEQKPASAGLDLRSMLGRGEPQAAPSAQKLNQTSVAHPAVFVIEYALAQLLIAWGVRPQAVTGHSVGEYVAACVAGVLSLPDALTLVARRAQMIQDLPGGAMLAVLLSEEAVQPFLSADLSLSAVNAPSSCVLGGPVEAIAALEKSLLEQGVAYQRVQTSHAFHSHMLDPIVEPLTDLVRTFKLNPPDIPYLSNLTGTWITPEQATDPGYWARHSRHPVRFADGVRELWQDPTRILLEVGPGHTLSTMAVQHPASGGALERVLSTIRHANERETDLAFLLNALGQLWMAGVPVDWSALYGEEQRRRVPLPTYPFERLRYWIEPGDSLTTGPAPASRQKDLGDWFYVPSWKRSIPPVREPRQATIRWLLFSGGGSLCTNLARQLEAQGDAVVTVFAGKQFVADDKGFVIRPGAGEDYQALLAALDERGQAPDKILHLWNVSALRKRSLNSTDEIMLHGFYSLTYLTQALGQRERDVVLPVLVVASKTQQVASAEELYPARATLLGPCQVMAHDAPRVVCRSLDVETLKSRSRQEAELVERIIVEAEANAQDLYVAYRGRDRWVRVYEPAPLPEPPQAARRAGLRPVSCCCRTSSGRHTGASEQRWHKRSFSAIGGRSTDSRNWRSTSLATPSRSPWSRRPSPTKHTPACERSCG
jgi:acyl transferase domain-containing protein